jgi:hypothetical protein
LKWKTNGSPGTIITRNFIIRSRLAGRKRQRLEGFGESTAGVERATVLGQAASGAIVAEGGKLRAVTPDGAEFCPHRRGDVFEFLRTAQRRPDFVREELRFGAGAAKRFAQDRQSRSVVGMLVFWVWEVNARGRYGSQDRAQLACSGLELFADKPVGKAQKFETLEAKDFSGSGGFGLAQGASFFLRKVFEAQFPRGKEDGGEAIASIGVEPKGAATADRLIIWVWGNDEDVHRPVARRA